MTFPLTKLSEADQDFIKMPSGGSEEESGGADDAEGSNDLAEGWTEGVFGRYKVKYLLYEGASLDKSKNIHW